MAFTFKGTYTQNDGDAAAAGTVEIFARGAASSLASATLDSTGSYSLLIDAEEGEMKVVETLTGVPVRSYEASVSRGSVTDTSRDIGYVGATGGTPASQATDAEVAAAITTALTTGPFAPTMTGAVSATRYVGGTAAVAPTTGTFLAGDFVTTLTGQIYICTVAGSPGTWVLGLNGAYVATTGNESIAGVKTFTGTVAAPLFLGTAGANGDVAIRPGTASGAVTITNSAASANNIHVDNSGNITLRDAIVIQCFGATGIKIGGAGSHKLGFFGAAPVIQQAGVAVTVGAIHAALVNLGLITA